MNIIAVLFWKHLVVRKRRFIHTIVDLFSPLAFFLLLFLFREYINPGEKVQSKYEAFSIQNTEPVDINNLMGPTAVFYHPDTELTGLLMDEVGRSLQLQRNEHTPGYLQRTGYMPFNNVSEVLKNNRKLSETDAVVFFENVNGSWPKRLNYTIHVKGKFRTNRVSADEGSIGPHEYFGTMYEPFMRLQWAIDSSYLKLLTGNEIPQNVTIQEFPYASDKQVPIIKIVCEIVTVVNWMSLLLTFVFLMSKLLEERISGIQELIKMVGVTNTQLNVSHFLNLMPVGLVYSVGATIFLKVSSSPVIPKSSPILIAVFLIFHFVSLMSMAYCCSYVVRNIRYSTSLASMAYVVLYLPAHLLMTSSGGLKVLGLLPLMPMHWFWKEVGEMEAYGKGANFASISKSHASGCCSIMLALIFMVVQTVLFMVLGWYLSLINPGPYAQALPWNFPCSLNFWSKKTVVPEEEAEELTELRDPLYFEALPKDMHPGIKIMNVSKVFPKHRALSNVCLDVYRGEITVLLGHNGAGKTTLMSIITGMLTATEGKVFVEGHDTVTQKTQMRKLLGLCPQHNLFFPDLTIMEHVIFFSMLKGNSYKDARDSCSELLGQLGLAGKGNSLSSHLSGGMKRRLQLACSLAGDATVLILDEPTSGLDVETRRELWDLLLSLRGSRTVLLSTHFMEEADALGDRVAALHSGRLVCHATTMHLKKAIGTGYRLSIITLGAPMEPEITAAIKSEVPEVTLKERSLNTVTYNLPSSSTKHFPQLFNKLESKRSELGITSIGVGISTLEEVFLKLCSDTVTSFSTDETDAGIPEPTYKLTKGMKLCFHQFILLVKRQLKFIYTKKITFLLLNIMLPNLLIISFGLALNEVQSKEPEDKQIALDLNLYNEPHKRAMVNTDAGANYRALYDSYPTVDFEQTDDVANAILRTGKKDIFLYNKYLVGMELNDTHANALYTTLVRHAAPVSLSLLSNAMATRLLPAADGRVLNPHIVPLQTEPSETPVMPKSTINCLMWAIMMSVVTLIASANYASLPCTERQTGTRHLHYLSGCSPTLHWMSALCTHSAMIIVTLVIPVVVISQLDSQHTLDKPEFAGTALFTLILMVLTFLAFAYFLSLFFGERGTTVFLVIIIVFFGFLTPTIMTATETVGNKPKAASVVGVVLKVACHVLPPHSSVTALIKATNVAHLNAFCDLNRDKCLLPDDWPPADIENCCVKNINPKCYFCFDSASPVKDYILTLFQFTFYMALVQLLEGGRLSALMERFYNSSYRPTSTGASAMVAAEKQYVDKAITLPKREITDAVLVNDVHKRYFSLFSKPVVAVKGISFSVKKGECFGLLGVNGAGKSSTFKMLAALQYPSKGSIFVNGHFMCRSSSAYLQSLGYCPQFFGLDDFLSGRDNLALLLTMRGLQPDDVGKEVDSWIKIVGLERYAAREVSGYSGGCARRLSAAASLCGGAPVALLDEPTAGVDVAARRRVWAALRRASPNRAIIITSHSMDEMEALCNRIGIMTAGRLRALGSAAELRAEHGSGHAVRLKLTPGTLIAQGDETDSSQSELSRLKVKLHETFDCTLRDEHKTMLHYHIKETMRYSKLFTELEKLKTDFPSLVEDYDITETTLEEVFLSLAKEELEPPAVV